MKKIKNPVWEKTIEETVSTEHKQKVVSAAQEILSEYKTHSRRSVFAWFALAGASIAAGLVIAFFNRVPQEAIVAELDEEFEDLDSTEILAALDVDLELLEDDEFWEGV